MILLTPQEAAAEFGIAVRTVQYWAEDLKIAKHERDDRAGRTGPPGYRVARHEVAAQVRKMPHRGGRRSPSPDSRAPQPEPHPTSPPRPDGG